MLQVKTLFEDLFLASLQVKNCFNQKINFFSSFRLIIRSNMAVFLSYASLLLQSSGQCGRCCRGRPRIADDVIHLHPAAEVADSQPRCRQDPKIEV